MKLSKEDHIKLERTASRNVELELNLRRPTHRVHKSKKVYSRKNQSK